MKKFTSILLVILLALSIFTACQRDETPTTTSSTIEESNNVSEHPPLFSDDTVKETYLNLLETGKFHISCQQEQDSLEYLSDLYDAYYPRLFMESGAYVLVYLNKSDGYLYKNDERLNVHCTDFIDIDSLVNLHSLSSSEVDEVYTEAKKGITLDCSEADLIARSLALNLLSEKFEVYSIDYPRFFRNNSEIVIIYEVAGPRQLEIEIVSVSILR